MLIYEYDNNHYCSTAGFNDCPEKGNCLGCPDCHRKRPTPEQYEDEYGREVFGDCPVWILMEGINGWQLTIWVRAKTGSHFFIDRQHTVTHTVVAIAPYGRPCNDWRPE